MDVDTILAIIVTISLPVELLGALMAFSFEKHWLGASLITLAICTIVFIKEISDLEIQNNFVPLTWEQVINHFKPW